MRQAVVQINDEQNVIHTDQQVIAKIFVDYY